MRQLLVLGLAVMLLAGCKRQATTPATPPAKTTVAQPTAPAPAAQPSGQTTMHAPTGVVINPGLGSGGSGGAVQAVRKAVGRTVQQHELNNIRQFIDTASSVNGRMPTAQETMAALQREAPATFQLVQDGSIVLTGVQRREGIWAYTRDPQTVGGEHLIVTNMGIERLVGQQLQQRLAQQR